MNTKSSTITKYALISAIVFIGFAIDTFIFRPILPFTPAIASIATVLALSLLRTKKEAIVAGFSFGLFSLIRAFILPWSVESFWVSFTNPIISLLPRIFVGLVARLVFDSTLKLFKKFSASCILASIVGVMTNTLGVCLMLFLMKSIFVIDFALWPFIKDFFSLNWFLETLVSVCVVPLLCAGLKRSEYFKGN